MESEWKWEDHPDVCLSDFCAYDDCRRCAGTFLDDDAESQPCGHPCHDQDGAK